MKRYTGLLAIPALIAAGACALPQETVSDTGQYANGSAMSACWIEFSDVSGQTILELYAAPGLEGSYELEVRQVSSSGDVVMDQSGPFSAVGDAPARISQLTLGGNAHRRGASLGDMMASMRSAQPGKTVISSDSADAGAYEVRLRLLDDSGREICAAERTGP